MLLMTKCTKNVILRKLDAHEKEILEAFDLGELKKAKNEKEHIKRHVVAADNF